GHVVLATTETNENGGTNVLGGDAVLRQLGARPGITLFPNDSDGVMRHMPYDLQKLTSLGIVTAEVASGHTIERPGTNSLWVDFHGKAGTIPTYSYVSVLRGRVPPSVFANKVVVLGLSSLGDIKDMHLTSAAGDGVLSGPEIQANAIHTALH